MLGLDLGMKFLPFLIQVLSVLFVLLNCIQLLLLGVHLECFIKCKRIDFLQDGLEGDQGLLQNLMPMVFGQVNNDWHEHWEGLLLVSLEDVQEVVVLKEAHGSISNLKMDTTDALDNSLEESWDQMFDLVNLTDLKDFLKFGQEKSLLDAVGKWPVLQKSF